MTENKKPPKKKKKFIKKLNKKQKLGIGTTSIITLAAIFTGICFFWELPEKPKFLFICGLDDAPNSIDPLKNPSPKYVNLIIIDQVAEGLFAYDQNQTNTPIIPNLALNGTWSSDHLNFTCHLRKDITFHDGTPFNAEAVKWNFDRIYKFIEIMPETDIWAWDYFYLNSEGKPIINHTEIINDYVIRFVLNQPFVPIRDLLSVWTSYILSPTSTPEDEFIDIRTGRLVGTGPFILDSCEVNYKGYGLETYMHANPDYWAGMPSIDKLSFIYLDAVERKERMLSGELSYIIGERDNETLDIFRTTPEITVIPKKVLNFWYFGMNNKVINSTMRKAISYAFNYTRYIKTVWKGHAERTKSPLSEKMRYSNWEDFDVPYYNITKAREVLIDANWPGTTSLIADDNVSAGNKWEKLANNSTPLAIYNFSVCNPFMELAANLTIRDLNQIGLKVNLINMGTVEFECILNKGKFGIFTLGWGVTCTDPVDIINPLFSSKVDGISNYCNFNDTQIQKWMEDALEEFNETDREQLYFNIQRHLIETLYPFLWLVSPLLYDVWDSNVKGIPIAGAPLRLILKYAYIN